MKFPISEIFYSIQGEGRNTGKPSIFIRFRGCNLACSFCDSKYSRHKDYTGEMKLMELYEVVDEIKKYPCTHIILTGGEPALFEKHIKVLQEIFADYTFEIETNGSIELQNTYNQVNVSYKTSNSGNSEYELKAIDNVYYYKFVVKDEKDLEEVEKIIDKYNLARYGIKDNIYLMPLGVDEESQTNLVVAEYCKKTGYRYCQRMHILLFGNKKGV